MSHETHPPAGRRPASQPQPDGTSPPPGFSTLNEKPLHAALKRWYARTADPLELRVDGFFVDVVRGRLLVEIQTRGFASIRRKLETLAAGHRVRLVHPIANEKWIVKTARNGRAGKLRRRSPKRGTYVDVFTELVSIPKLVAHPNFSIEILLTAEEEIRKPAARPRWRKSPWVTVERRLTGILERRVFRTPADFLALVPADMAEPFTTRELAKGVGRPRWLGQKMAYCLREMGAIETAGKQGNAILYRRREPLASPRRPKRHAVPAPPENGRRQPAIST